MVRLASGSAYRAVYSSHELYFTCIHACTPVSDASGGMGGPTIVPTVVDGAQQSHTRAVEMQLTQSSGSATRRTWAELMPRTTYCVYMAGPLNACRRLPEYYLIGGMQAHDLSTKESDVL